MFIFERAQAWGGAEGEEDRRPQEASALTAVSRPAGLELENGEIRTPAEVARSTN